jgi:hypothetical protein
MAERDIRTNVELAGHARVTVAIAEAWRSGVERPSRAGCARLAKLFGRPVEEVLRTCEYRLREADAGRDP